MKNKILLASATSAGLATLIGIVSVLTQGGADGETFQASMVTSLKLYQVAGMFGLLSIATFFVGWVTPASKGGN